MSERKPSSRVGRRNVLKALAGAGLTSSLGGVLTLPGTAVAATPRRGGRIRVASVSSSIADTLDPAKGSLSTDYARHYMLYSGLTQYDENLAAQPALAVSLESDDQVHWTIKLRSGVEFHNGKSLTSADVVYSLLRHKDPAVASKMAAIAKQFIDIKATGELELSIRLNGPNADLPVILADSHFLIVADGTSDFRTANGTGPYRLKSFEPGIRTVGVRSDNYWKTGRPYIDEIELIGIPDETSRANALLSGDVQLVNAVNPRQTRRINASPDHAVLETKSGLYTDLIMRADAHPTSNPDFVLAMKYLLNRELIKKALFRGYAEIGNDHPIAPSDRHFDPDLPQREYDPERARFHLQKSGLAGIRVPMYASPAAPGSVDTASLLQEAAAGIGLRLAVNRVPADGYWSNHWMKHALGFGNINPRPTADLKFSLFFKSDAPWNVSGWHNEQFDQLVVAARAEGDEEKRRQMYADMQALVHHECGVGIPVFISLLDGYDARIKGLGSIPTGGLMGYSFADHIWWDG